MFNGLEEVQGEWELDDLVNDLHKEWSAHEGNKDGKHFDLEEVNVFNVNKDLITESCKKQKNAAITVLEPVIFLDGNDANVTTNDVQQAGCQARPKKFGPWSLDWLSSLSKGESGIASTFKILKGGEHMPEVQIEKDFPIEPKQQDKKTNSKNFKHSAGFLKRVARMSSSDRREISKFLKKQDRKRNARKQSTTSKVANIPMSGSSKNSNSSVNKDWENWVVMHEKKEVVKADVKEIGRVLGVSFKGDPNNSFSLLSKEGRRGWRAAGGCEMEGESEGGGSLMVKGVDWREVRGVGVESEGNESYFL